MTQHHIAIVDDHPLFRDALKQTLAASFADLRLSEAGSLTDLGGILDAGDVDLVLLDLTMPGVQGFSGLIYLRSLNPSIPVVVVSANESPSVIRRCLDFGASGFIPKSLPVASIRQAIASILQGEIWVPPGVSTEKVDDVDTAALVERLATLTPQQVRVLMMLGEGLLNKQIAFHLGVSEATVKAHVSAILQKLRVESRTQAVIAVKKIESGELGDFKGEQFDPQK
ncbi:MULTISPECIES: response regulator transcription factor [Rhodomicrobium]|uniref:response regulator transcription factor n=1 Tax=Rhodomicrobium TaxID=1068 RepID=UPI000B4B1AE8|nr:MULTISPECIES: response regulator transcription factor [Rhodomicrobium]